MHKVSQGTAAEPRKLHVLIVEDDELSAALAASALGLFGCTFERVFSGEEAIEAAAANHFDAILMDYRLKGMDGATATRQIRADEQLAAKPRSLIVGVTASVMPGELIQFQSSGIDDVLTKPLMLDELRDRIVLRNRSVAEPAPRLRHGGIQIGAVRRAGPLHPAQPFVRNAVRKARRSAG